jgi:hypothetical protein
MRFVARDKMSLVNADGGAPVFGFGKIRSGDTLPEKLELDGVPRAPVPPPHARGRSNWKGI